MMAGKLPDTSGPACADHESELILAAAQTLLCFVRPISDFDHPVLELQASGCLLVAPLTRPSQEALKPGLGQEACFCSAPLEPLHEISNK